MRWIAAVATGGLLAVAAPARAQDGGDGFLFRAPTVALTLRAGRAAASARSDLFDFAMDTLTLGRRDFAGVSLGAELAVGGPGSRIDAVVGVAYASSSAPSEFRNWVDANDQPIVQTTTLRRVPVTLGVRAWLVPRGRTIGRLAWVPARVAPYAGAGVGATWYRFRQEGDFVDFETRDVFGDSFETSGWGPSAYGSLGMDVTLTPRIALTADARYAYARASVGGDFAGFDKVDLSGLATTAGLTFRF